MLERFDLFSKPFQLLFKKKESAKTSAGGFLSIIIILTGLAYLIYLLNNWLSGNLQPNIISFQQTAKEANLTEITLFKSPVLITMIDYKTKIPVANSILQIISRKKKQKITFIDCSQ